MEITFRAPTGELAYKMGMMVVHAIQEELSGSRHGRFYPVPGNIFYDRKTAAKERADNYYVKFTGARSRSEIKGSAYQASAPGEPPAVRTGRLRQSFYLHVIAINTTDFLAKITTNVYYADDMEYGTEKVSPRPFVKPAMLKIEPKLHELRKEFFYEIVKRGTL